MGVEHVPIAIKASSLSPIDGVRLSYRYASILKQHQPDLYLSYTPMPNVFGSFAAHALSIPVINNIAGLGRAFLKAGVLSFIVGRLFKLALFRSRVVFFQNSQDQDHFLARGYVRAEQVRLLPGSGVDLSHFTPAERSSADAGEAITFLLVARLLRAKGIAEFAEAARILRRTNPKLRFRLVGIEQSGPDAVSKATLASWAEECVLEHLPPTDDVRTVISQADCVVLPSRYPEGTPRVLLEASAMGKPLIATDIPGCREVVLDGTTGFLCGNGDAASLVGAMQRMLSLTPSQRAAMGCAARAHVEANYDEKLVINAYLAAIEAALAQA
jgi:glycosyltransferase involved in cell wall biosynthesis